MLHGEAGIPDTGGSEVDVDALMSEIEGGSSHEIPMEQPRAADPTPAPEQSQPAAPHAPEIAFNWNGKQIKAPITDPRVTQWASQGYDYAQRTAELKAQQEQFKTEQQKYQELVGRYREVDEYIQKDPQWWDHVQSAYQQRTAGAQQPVDPSNPVVQKMTALETQLSELSKFKDEVTQERLSKQREQEDQQLTQEIQSLRESHKELDWDVPDETGKTLEFRVLEHASKTGINNFRAAFRDYNHDRLLKIAEERAKEKVTKDIQKNTKLGLLGTSSAPKRALSDAVDIKNKSYEQLLAEALEESQGRGA